MVIGSINIYMGLYNQFINIPADADIIDCHFNSPDSGTANLIFTTNHSPEEVSLEYFFTNINNYIDGADFIHVPISNREEFTPYLFIKKEKKGELN